MASGQARTKEGSSLGMGRSIAAVAAFGIVQVISIEYWFRSIDEGLDLSVSSEIDLRFCLGVLIVGVVGIVAVRAYRQSDCWESRFCCGMLVALISAASPALCFNNAVVILVLISGWKNVILVSPVFILFLAFAKANPSRK